MNKAAPLHIKTIAQYHRFRGLPAPEHPSISLVDIGTITHLRDDEPKWVSTEFYFVGLKHNVNARMRYGQQDYDFNNGVLSFLAPRQVFGLEAEPGTEMKHSGWILMFHPDFLWGTSLAQKMNRYEFFGYAVNEALHLSHKEEQVLQNLLQTMGQEVQNTIDKFSQDIIVTLLETLLNYADRFYQRQFITRNIQNHALIGRMEELLVAHFANGSSMSMGLPTVQSLADALCISPNYLSGVLKVSTGFNAQQHIHNKLIEKAKEQLSSTALSISEIAYELGFEYPQSFSKLFKAKTQVTPQQFRASFE